MLFVFEFHRTELAQCVTELVPIVAAHIKKKTGKRELSNFISASTLRNIIKKKALELSAGRDIATKWNVTRVTEGF